MRLKDLLYINRSDRRVLAFILILATVFLAVLYFVGGGEMYTEGGTNDSARLAAARRHGGGPHGNGGYGGYSDYNDGKGYYAVPGSRAERFPFDPNTADSTELLSLGLKPWQVRNIYKYRAAGGVYRYPEDFAKLYGLTKKQFDELRPYIRISEAYHPSVEFYEPRPRHVNIPDSIARHHIDKLKPGERIDLNGADTTLLKRVPGIGSYYARRIDSYRRWLGGFYTEDQLLEIEYFPKEALQYFYVDSEPSHKLNVNKLSLSELKRHPYINYYQAKDIVDYRRLRGNLKSIDDLRLLKDFSERDLDRLRHYVEY